VCLTLGRLLALRPARHQNSHQTTRQMLQVQSVLVHLVGTQDLVAIAILPVMQQHVLPGVVKLVI